MNKLSIVVPYRNRPDHLKKFIGFFQEHPINVENYEINIIEQHDEKLFNRAKLLNVGFDLSQDDCDYFAFHDIDMLPLEADYGYPESPTHIAGKVEQFGWKKPYSNYFGGVTLFNKEDFLKINGYSNEYWGWGAEDDDVLLRCEREGLEIQRKNSIFESMFHKPNGPNHEHYKENVNKLNQFSKDDKYKNMHKEEGYTSLNYDIIDKEIKNNSNPEIYLHKVKL